MADDDRLINKQSELTNREMPWFTEEFRQRNAARITLISTWIFAIVAVASLVITILGVGGRTFGAVAMLVLAAISGVSAVIVRRGRATAGIMMLLVCVLLVLASQPFLFSGISIQAALMGMIVVSGISLATLPNRLAGRMILAAAVVGVAIILVDNYGNVGITKGNSLSAWIAVGILGVFYGFFVVQQFSNFPLRIKLLISFLLVAMLPLGVLAVVNIVQASQRAQAQASQTLLNSASEIAYLLDNFILQRLDEIRIESNYPALREYLRLPAEQRAGSPQEEQVRSLLTGLSSKDPVFINSYAILDAKGIDIYDTNGDDIGLDKSGRDYFMAPMASGLPYVSPVRYSDSLNTNGQTINFSSVVRDETGQPLGVLRNRYAATVLQALIIQLIQRTDPEAYVVLVDNQQYIRLAHSIDPTLIGKSYAPLTAEQVQQLIDQGVFKAGTTLEQTTTNQPDMVKNLSQITDQGIFTSSSAAVGEQALTGVVRLKEMPWGVLVRKPVSVVLQPVQALTRSSVALALLAIVVVAAAAYFVSQALTAPIGRLTGVAEQVAGGDLTARATVEAQDEIGVLAQTFNIMTSQLRTTLAGLENRVSERTRAIELSADVSRRLSTILDPEQLVSEVVDLLQFAFGYYHAQIYLFDEAGEKLQLVGGTGEAGKALLERGHSIPRARGLVGRACETGVPVVVSDTASDLGWLPNPLLPDTKAEAAVPIIYGDQVLGALDVQQNLVNGLGAQDADLLQGIANQVAIALRNARQYQQAQEQAEREARTSEMIRLIQETQTVESALQVAVREMGRALNASRARIRLEPATDAARVRLAVIPPAANADGNGAGSEQQSRSEP